MERPRNMRGRRGASRRTSGWKSSQWRQRGTWSVGGQLAAATALVVVFFGAVGAYSALNELRQARTTATREAAGQAGTAAKALTAGWAEIATQVASLAQNPSVPGVLAAGKGCHLSFSLGLIPDGHLDLVTPDGTVVCSSEVLPPSGVSQAGAGWLASLISAKGVFGSNPFRDALTRQTAVAVAAPVSGPTGRLVGAAVVVAPVAALADAVAIDYGGPQHYQFALTDRATGAVLSTPAGGHTAAGSAGRNPIATPTYFYGVAAVPAAGWMIYAGVRRSVALGPTRSILTREVIQAGLALLIILVLLEVIRRRFANPLRRLTAVIGDSGPHVDAALATAGGTREVVQLATSFREMREGRDAYETQLSNQALHDPLTGLPNRALLGDRLHHALTQSARSQGSVAVLFVDVDRFKLINDGLSHTVGDQVLIILAARLANTVRSDDTLARFGGDEFVIVCEDLPDPKKANDLADRLAEVIGEPLEVTEHVVRLTVSIGISIAKPGSTADELLRDADAAMYQAKRRGGACWEISQPHLQEASESRLALETELRVAVERGELHLVYQPKIDLTSGMIDGIEALLRWDHPALGPIPPNTFIPVAEETGLIVAIGFYALNAACDQAVVWQQRGFDVPVSVNLSARQLAEPHLADRVAAVLAERNLQPDRLCLELTESALMVDPNRAPAALAAFKELGIRLSIDDFGTGYSSLSYLQRFPFDELKIDRAFINELTASQPDRNLVAAIVAMSQALGLQTVAEGVETRGQVDQLRRLGCGSAQGYLYARPAPADAIIKIMSDGTIPTPLVSPR